jgi:23S rRNA-/tRNA-specific pseudouridylate synthase
MNEDLQIIYQSPAVKVIDKPSGALSTDISDLICHRLDRDTSGCLIVAKNNKYKLEVQEQFKQRQVNKEYWALTIGRQEDNQTIEGWLERNPKNKTLMRMSPGFVRSADEFSKPEKDTGRNKRYSKTEFSLIKLFYKKVFKSNRENFNYFSLVKAIPVTGRKHQIRTHLKYLDRPILGDKWYGNKVSRDVNSRLAVKRLMLHAKKIDFYDPGTESRVVVTSPLPEAYLEITKGMIKK